jgi:hypothetical protein
MIVYLVNNIYYSQLLEKAVYWYGHIFLSYLGIVFQINEALFRHNFYQLFVKFRVEFESISS